jgi:sulfate transport system ATP-binding protein
VAVLHRGRIEQIGAPQVLAERPANRFVFEFLGDANRLPCVVEGDRAVVHGVAVPIANAPVAAGNREAVFRPYETDLLPASEPGVAVTVVDVLVKGAVLRAECRTESGDAFEADFPRPALPPGVSVGGRASLSPKRVFVFDDEPRS